MNSRIFVDTALALGPLSPRAYGAEDRGIIAVEARPQPAALIGLLPARGLAGGEGAGPGESGVGAEMQFEERARASDETCESTDKVGAEGCHPQGDANSVDVRTSL